jgi:ATP-dependent DNA helicase RecQ
MVALAQPLKQYFGHEAFLPGQEQLVEEALAGHDVFAVMPTGAGKSLIYQLAALLLPGVAVIVSPLIALMQDQVDRLHANGIAATFVNSTLAADEQTRRERAALRGEVKLLYVAPERLLTPRFLALMDQMQRSIGLSLLVIDEAHCVSEWGHDFRPEYRQISQVRDRFPQVPVLALTATATERVRKDIITQLKLRQPHLHLASFNRPNLTYEVRPKTRRAYDELLQLLRQQPDASTIIYCQSRKSVEDLATALTMDGIRALPYHAGMENTERAANQDHFIRDDVPVLVATVAFGMGIAKPDVRAVIHYDLPRTLAGYYQESGRAGRDGLPAACIIFYGQGDRAKLEHLVGQHPDAQEARIARQQLQQVVAYCEANTCRRTVLLGYFGETFTETPCSGCDVCQHPATMVDRTVDAQKLLSCIGRTQERFGMRHMIDILRGANTQKIRELHHDQLPTYGRGNDLSTEEWLHIGRSLLHQGILRESDDGYAVPKLTSAAWDVLKNGRTVLIAALTAPAVASPTRGTANNAPAELPAESQGLFQHLRALRKRLADAQGIAPYMIFADTTLRAMAVQRPQTEEQFAQISGVGARKIADYFIPFTEAIRDYCTEHDLSMGLTVFIRPATRPIGRADPTQRITLGLFNEGLSIAEIAARRNIHPRTVMDHLAKLVQEGEAIDPDRLIAPERFQVIANAIRQIGGTALKPIKEFLGDDYDYAEIHLVRAFIEQGA